MRAHLGYRRHAASQVSRATAGTDGASGMLYVQVGGSKAPLGVVAAAPVTVCPRCACTRARLFPPARVRVAWHPPPLATVVGNRAGCRRRS